MAHYNVLMDERRYVRVRHVPKECAVNLFRDLPNNLQVIHNAFKTARLHEAGEERCLRKDIAERREEVTSHFCVRCRRKRLLRLMKGFQSILWFGEETLQLNVGKATRLYTYKSCGSKYGTERGHFTASDRNTHPVLYGFVW